ncbi:hypothetical protein CR513_24817, partial [Mucuna pruriens]
MTNNKLFPLLLEQKLVEVVPLKPLEPPYPRNQAPIVQSNPLPAHKGMAINTISHESKDEVEGANRRKEKRTTARHAGKWLARWRKYPTRAS